MGRQTSESSISAVGDRGQEGGPKRAGEKDSLECTPPERREGAHSEAIVTGLPAANLVAIVGFTHVPELLDIFPQSVTFLALEMIIIQDVLNRVD
jgi:hypothetical protein